MVLRFYLLVGVTLVSLLVSGGATGVYALELSGEVDGVALTLPLPEGWERATADELVVHRALPSFLDAAVLGEGRGRRGVIVLTCTPYLGTERPERAPGSDGQGVVIGEGAAGLRAHLDTSVAAMDAIPGLQIVEHDVVAEPADAAPVGRLVVQRSDPGLARDLGFVGDDAITQISSLAAGELGLVQVFAYVPRDEVALAGALAAHIADHLRVVPRAGPRAPVKQTNATVLMIAVLAVALGLIVALRLYLAARQRHLRTRATGGSQAQPADGPQREGSGRDTPRAPWEDDLSGDLAVASPALERTAEPVKHVDPTDTDA